MTSLNIFACTSLYTQLPSQVHARNNSINGGGIEKVQNLLKRNGIPSIVTSPLESLQRGNWVKLICGASFEDVVDIRNLSLIYTLAGVDCIDCAADESVVNAVNDGIEAAINIVPVRRPWVMISVNDNEDLHFRKAEFDPEDCPMDCSRPCENVCPANAISCTSKDGLSNKRGVLAERCYGCGRCLSICPYDKIRATTYIRDVPATAKLLEMESVDAIEIHTSGRQAESFEDLWNGLGDSVDKLRLVAVSLPDLGDSTIPAMSYMYDTMKAKLSCHNVWQLDGRPMSGDIGRGATREAIAFAVRMTSIKHRPKGFLQLAGGTNAHTVEGLKKERLFQVNVTQGTRLPLGSYTTNFNSFIRAAISTPPRMLMIIHHAENLDEETSSFNNTSHALIGGVAFGGYARKIVGRVLSSIPEHGHVRIENYPDHLSKALSESLALVRTVKLYDES